MQELKMLYIAPEAEIILFMPVEGIASDWNTWGLRSGEEYDGPSGPGIGVGGGDDTDPTGDGEGDPWY